MIKEKLKAPNFELPSIDNTIFKLSEYLGKNIILFFYPRDNTKGCTLEANDFSNLNNRIKKNNCIVVGISKDIPTNPSMFEELKFEDKIKHYKKA